MFTINSLHLLCIISSLRSLSLHCIYNKFIAFTISSLHLLSVHISDRLLVPLVILPNWDYVNTIMSSQISLVFFLRTPQIYFKINYSWKFIFIKCVQRNWISIKAVLTSLSLFIDLEPRTHVKIQGKFAGQIPEKNLYVAILFILKKYQWKWLGIWLYFQKILGFPTFKPKEIVKQ